MQSSHVNCGRAGATERPSYAGVGLAGLLALAIAGCAGQSSPDGLAGMRIDPSQVRTPASDQRASYEYHVLAGEMAIQRGNRAIAAREYVAALEYSNDAELAERATRIALFADEPALAYRAAGAWAVAEPDSLDAQRTAARLAFATGDADGLAVYAPALIEAAASPDIGYRLLADVLSGAPERANLAVETASRLAQQDTDSAPAQYALGVVALRYERVSVAARAAERAMRLEPSWKEAVLLQAGVWIREGETDKAQQLIADLPGNDASRAQYHLALARLLVEADQNAAALHEFDRALALQPDNADARYGLAILALSVGDLDRAEPALSRLYDDGERADDAAYYLGTIYEQRENYVRAQQWYQRVENGSHAFESQVRAARMIYEQGDMAGARQRLDELRDIYPELGDQLYAAEGQLLYEANRPAKSLAVYQTGLDASPDSTELRYGRSMAYERLGRIEEAEADLRAVLDAEPSDARALNALGYLLASHTRRYAEAQNYIQQALDIEPDNPAILDSMGWVQYRQGNLDEARRYLERAYADFADPEVAAHLGEVLWQQGEHDAARRIWQDALAANPDHPVLRETVERFQP